MSQLTVNDITPQVEYAADTDDTGPYVVPFVFFDFEDVKVSIIDSSGNVTELTRITDWNFTSYTAATDGQGYWTGGEITLEAGEVTEDDMTVRIYRDTVIDRLVNYPFSGPISITALNDELNMVTMILQELEREKANYINLPNSAGDATPWDFSGRAAGSAGEDDAEDSLATNRQVDASGPNWVADDNAQTPVGVVGQWQTIYSASGIVIQGDEVSKTFDLLSQFFGFIQNRNGNEAMFKVRYRYQVDSYSQVTKSTNGDYPVLVPGNSSIPFNFMDIAQDIDYLNGDGTLYVAVDIYGLDVDSGDLYVEWGNLAVNTSEPR